MENKTLRKIILFFLSFIILITPLTNCFAYGANEVPDWWVYSFWDISSKEYYQIKGETQVPYLFNRSEISHHSTFLNLRLDTTGRTRYAGISDSTKLDSYDLTLRYATSRRYNSKAVEDKFNTPGGSDDPGEFIIDGKTYNYFKPVKHEYKIKYDDGKRFDNVPVWMILSIDNGVKTPEEEVKDLVPIANRKLDEFKDLSEEIIAQGEPEKVGDYHPFQSGLLLNAIGEWRRILFGGDITRSKFNPELKREQILASLDIMDELIDYVENHRIQEAEILDFRVGEYSGLIDKENKKVILKVPKEVVLDKKDIKLTTPDWVIAKEKNGELKIGESLVYNIEPIDIIHERYVKSNYNNMKHDWIIEVVEGESNLKANSLYYTSKDGRKINADILEDKINLQIPFEAYLKALPLEIYHTGQKIVYIGENGQEVEYKNGTPIDVSKPITLKIKGKNQEKEYTLDVSKEASKQNSITSFIVDNKFNGTIDEANKKIKIDIPFGYDQTKMRPVINTDYRATVDQASGVVQDFTNPVKYIITSESGDRKEYEVSVMHGEATSENKILSFMVGSIKGEIKDKDISVKVPKTVYLKNVKPRIVISQNAVVSPASSQEIDFSQGNIIYTVTAQNGDIQVYTVTITQEREGLPGPSEEYVNKLKKLRDNIYNRYKNETFSEDWEWMNIGFYEAEDNGFPYGIRKSAKDLPERFDLYKEIGELNYGKLTDLDRFSMTLTAMGIDASNLEPFQVDGKPFKTDLAKGNGKEATNLIKLIYNHSGGGINDYIYALLALDMGNYSVPEDAKWTREKLVEKLLDHEYGSDEFGVDMVAMLMQGLYPYREHQIYGDRVRRKLELGVDLILGNKSAKKVDPIDSSFLGVSWGNTNSESTAQIIIALCSMGIDPYSNTDFAKSEKNNMIVNWVNKFATYPRDGFGHTNNQYNFMGTYQSMYALQWYINFLENGSEPYSLYKDGVPFDFGNPLSSEAEIETFELLDKEGYINNENGTITIEIPKDTPSDKLKSLEPRISISKNSKISPLIGQSLDFNEEVSYRVTAEDGKTIKNYTIIMDKKDSVESGEKDIKDVKVEGVEKAKVEINQQERRIDIVLPPDTNIEKLKRLKLSLIHTADSISPSSEEPQDFSKGEIIYTLTAKDGTTAEYKVKVSIEEKAPFWFTKFVLRGVEGNIDKVNNEINLTLPFGTYLESVSPNIMEHAPLTANTSLVPAPTQLSNFDNKNGTKLTILPYPVDNKVDYTLKIGYKDPGGDSNIKSFKMGGYEGKIVGRTIKINVPNDVTMEDFKDDYEDQAPEIEGDYQTIDPNPILGKGEKNTLDSYLKDYILTDKEGNVNIYTIELEGGKGSSDNVDKPDKEKPNQEIPMTIESFNINGIEGQIDNANGRIYIELPYELDLRNVTPIIKVPNGSSIYPSSGQSLNLRRSARFALSNSKEVKEYVLIITISEPKPATKLWKYIKDNDDTVDYQVLY